MQATYAFQRLIPPHKDAAVRDECHRRLAAFLERTGSHPSPLVRCPGWLLGRRCGYGACEHRFPAEDHVQMFLRDGKPCAWTSQPYDVSDEQRAAIEALAGRFGLTWIEDEAGSWWYPGGTTLIVLSRGAS